MSHQSLAERVAGEDCLRGVSALRVSTEAPAFPPRREVVGVVLEAPLTVDVLGMESYTILCMPQDRRAVAVGFLYTEGIIDGLDRIAAVEEPAGEPGLIRIRLAGDLQRFRRRGRNLVITSACGACGNEYLEQQILALPRVGDRLRIEAHRLHAACFELREQQVLFDACGGTHAAGLFDDSGAIISFAEDIGRHNALDKAIGKCLLEGRATAGCAALLTGRVSLEMVGKCARAGIELVAAISAPTSLALEVAERCGISLCAFVRDNRATVFTHPRRVIA